MQTYTYPVFPLILIILGYGLVGLAIISAIFTIDYSDSEGIAGSVVGSIGLLAIGSMVISFRARFSIDRNMRLILKEYRVFGARLSTEKMNIPEHPDRILVVPKEKNVKGYVSAVVPFRYRLNSYDLYFSSGHQLFQIIKTDRKRALKIAEMIGGAMNLEYTVKESRK